MLLRQPGFGSTGTQEDFAQSHALAALPLALLGGLHEGVDLQGLTSADGGLTRLEEADDLAQQRCVVAEALLFDNALLSKANEFVLGRIHRQTVQGMQGAESATAPHTRHRRDIVAARPAHF